MAKKVEIDIDKEISDKKREYYISHLGNGMCAPDKYAEERIVRQAIKDAYKNANIKNTTKSKDIEIEVVNQRALDKQAEKEYKARMRLDTTGEDANVVFANKILNNVFTRISTFDKFVIGVFNKLNDSGKLDKLKNRNSIIITEENSRRYAACYKYLIHVTRQIKDIDDVVRFKLDGQFVDEYKRLKDHKKFKKYHFDDIHISVLDEPCIIEVSLKEGLKN